LSSLTPISECDSNFTNNQIQNNANEEKNKNRCSNLNSNKDSFKRNNSSISKKSMSKENEENIDFNIKSIIK
jgi:hypothetical protein